MTYYKNISIEDLKELVSKSTTMTQVMTKLGYTANMGNSYILVKKYLDDNNIDTSHFKGKAHGTTDTSRYSLDDILVENCKYSNMSSLKRRVLKAGLLKKRCAICGIDSWLGKPIVLQLDHINGNNRDNRIENLRLLCPNCHSQTETFCRKNK